MARSKFETEYPTLKDKVIFLNSFDLVNLQKAGKIGNISSKRMETIGAAIKSIINFDEKNKFLICRTMFNNPKEYKKKKIDEIVTLEIDEIGEYLNNLNDVPSERWDELTLELNKLKSELLKQQQARAEEEAKEKKQSRSKSNHDKTSTQTLKKSRKAPIEDDETIVIDSYFDKVRADATNFGEDDDDDSKEIQMNYRSINEMDDDNIRDRGELMRYNTRTNRISDYELKRNIDHEYRTQLKRIKLERERFRTRAVSERFDLINRFRIIDTIEYKEDPVTKQKIFIVKGR